MAYIDQYGTKFSEDRKKLIKFSSEISDYSIPEGTEEIGINAFKGNKTLKALHLPSTITFIRVGALEDCNINEIHYAGDVKQWLQIAWKSVFSKGYKLYFNEDKLVESIIIPESISVIKECAFYYCSSLKTVIFNKNIITIEKDAFNKSGLKGILSIPKSCKTIYQYAFFNCSGITKVKIPESTEEIWYGAFSSCYGIQNFVVSKDNNYFFTDGIGLYSFFKEYETNKIDKLKLRLVALASGNNNKYRLHEHTVAINREACCFSSIPGGELEIPHEVSLVEGAFRSCKSTVKAPLKMRKAILEQSIPSDKIKTIFDYRDSLISKDIPEIISLNPFRVLGVYCNASQREIQSNAARIKRFLEIGKQPTFESDFNEILPPFKRTQEMVDKALSQISQPREKLAHAMFWFSKPCSEQQKIIESLIRKKEFEDAYKLLKNDKNKKRVTAIYYLFLNENCVLDFLYVSHHYLTYTEIFDDESQSIKQTTSLLEEICGDKFFITKEECQVLYLDMLMTFINPIYIWACQRESLTSKGIKDYIFNKSIGKNINHINTLIASVASCDNKNTSRLLKITQDLKQNTFDDIAVIDEYLASDDIQLISVHDALAKQILQSAIDCYNKSDNRELVAREVYSLMSYAKILAKSDLLKGRCDDNLKTVKTFIDDLPPQGLEKEDKELIAAITRSRNSADTIDQAKKLLKSVEPQLFQIKLKQLSEKNKSVSEQISAYFTKVSTAIANVCLNKLIEDVNSSSSNKSSEAWGIITALNQLPLDPDFKTIRYNDNVSILINNIGTSFFGLKHSPNEISYSIIDLRTEDVLWQHCERIKNYNQYIKRFPNGKNINLAKELQQETDRRKEELRRKREEEKERQRQLEIEELYRQEKLERETKVLNWTIAILAILIFFMLVYLLWGWDGIQTLFIIIGIILGLMLWGWITG